MVNFEYAVFGGGCRLEVFNAVGLVFVAVRLLNFHCAVLTKAASLGIQKRYTRESRQLHEMDAHSII